MKQVFAIISVILIIVLIFIALVGLEVGSYKLGGFLGTKRAEMVGTINTEVVKQEDKVFKNSTQYIENQINQLSKIKLEMVKAGDNGVLKKALAEEVIEGFADFDAAQIKNDGLRTWFLNILDGVY
jgi:hypothetical protein